MDSISNSAASVVVHPLVLLGIVDHHGRVTRGGKKRVVGVLLGDTMDGRLHVSNSFAAVFDEDPKDRTAWFMDKNYTEEMARMFKKVSVKERIVGWYSTESNICANDMDIHGLFSEYTSSPVLLVTNVVKDPNSELSIDVYERAQNADGSHRFAKLTSCIDSFEAEDIGVEHLLRDVALHGVQTVTGEIRETQTSLGILSDKLQALSSYAHAVAQGKAVYNEGILQSMQEALNLLPTSQACEGAEYESADNLLAMYTAEVIRMAQAFHLFVNSKTPPVKAAEVTPVTKPAGVTNPQEK